MLIFLYYTFWLTSTVNCDFTKIQLHQFESSMKNLDVFNKNDGLIRVHLLNYYDIQYYGVVNVGTPPQTFKAIFSTGSTIFWLPSVTCDICSNNKFNSSKSSTYRKIGTKLSITNKSDSLVGILSADQISIGGVTINDQVFVEVSEKYDNSFYGEYDCFVGMGYSKNAAYNSNPLFCTMVEQGVVEKSIFSFHFNKYPHSEIGGELTLGGSDPAYYKGSFTYLPVIRPGYWQIELDKINVKGVNVCADGCLVSINTGIGLITGPTNQVKEINNAMGNSVDDSQNIIVDCKYISKLPDIHFILGGKKFILTGRDYVIEIIQETIHLCMSGIISDMNQVADGKDWNFGVIFLRKFHAQFDLENNRIGFAETV